ncbi:MAG: hypothetical protein J7641_09550 [Cyanobacteria bacterium SID2]|nr:hypothetical protein [Cyanobacteria bacterium SID2]MBP0002100.1 hypothetical protein [Cyanobacteria bacterium SBC]
MQRTHPWLLVTCLGSLVGCTPAETIEASPTTVASPTSTPIATSTPSPQSTPDPWQQGLQTAMGAANLVQSASSPQDWTVVAGQWQRSIDLLKTVPDRHPQKSRSQEKIAEYQRNLAYAQQQIEEANEPSTPIPQAIAPTPTPSTEPAVSPKVALARHLKSIGAKVYETYQDPSQCSAHSRRLGGW